MDGYNDYMRLCDLKEEIKRVLNNDDISMNEKLLLVAELVGE